MAIENVNQKPAAASAALADYLIASIGGKVRRVPINTLADILTDAEVGIINAAAEALISAAGKSSYIGTNGNWYVWDGKKNAFVDSGKPSRGEKGNAGVIFTPYLSEDGILSWTNNGNLPNPKPVKLSGAGEVTAESIKEALGYTPIGEDDLPISSVNGQTGTVETSWYFNVMGSVLAPTTTQTVAQIVAAQTAGFAPICKATFSDFTVPESATTTKAMYLPQNFVGIPAANNGSVEDALAWINNTMGTDGSKCAQNVPFEDYDAWYQTAQAELFDIDESCNKLMYASLYQAVSKLVGAKVAVLGDSLTEQSACSFITSAYNDRWMENVLRDTARTGDDGKTYKGSGWFALIARKYKIKWWCAGHGAQWWYSTTERPNGATAMVRKLIDGTDEFDYIVLEYGTNDIISGYTHIGTAADEASETATTSCGAIKWCIEQLQTRFPEASIVVILPNIHSGANGEAPATQQAYLDAVVPILKQYGVRRVNMAEDSGIVKSMMYTDGVHLRWPVVRGGVTYYTNDTPAVRKFSKCLEAELLKA